MSVVHLFTRGTRDVVRRAAFAGLLALLAIPFVPATVSATDPIINPPSLPCFVFFGQPGWIPPAGATDDSFTREGGELSDPTDTTHFSLLVPAPGVLGNDGTGAWHAALYSGPAHAAQFTLNSDGSFHYVPVAGYLGGDSFTYVRYLIGGECSTGATVTIAPAISLRGQDDVYVAYADSTLNVGNVGGGIAICAAIQICGVLNNDLLLTQPGAAEPAAMVVEGRDVPANGLVTETHNFKLTGPRPTPHGTVDLRADGSFSYTPAAGFTGTDYFGYALARNQDDYGIGAHVQDMVNLVGTVISWDWTVVRINVVNPPAPTVAKGVNDAVSVVEDTRTTIQSSTLLANDVNATNITFLQTTFFPYVSLRTQHGTLTPTYFELFPGNPFTKYVGSMDYTPDANFTGQDTFAYFVSSGYSTTWNTTDFAGIVVITVTPVADPPTAVRDTATTDFNQPITIDAVANDTDPEGDLDPSTLQRDTDPCRQAYPVSSCFGTDDPSGWTTLAHGTWQPHADGTITYTPTPGFIGTAGFPYVVCDAGGRCDWEAVIVTVRSVGDDSYQTPEDTTLAVVAPGVLGNDRAGVTATVVTTTQHGALTLQPNGAFSYVPAANFFGTDSFTYAIGSSDTAEVTIQVDTVNDAPDLALNGYCDHSIPFIVCGPGSSDVRDIVEGGTAELNGSIKDPEFDGGTLTVQWGDGATTTVAYPCSGAACPFTTTATYSTGCIGTCGSPLFFHLTHVYADDPAGSGDYYAISGSAEEADASTDTAGASARVVNVAPELTVSPDGCDLCLGSYSHLVKNTGEQASIAGRVVDPGLDGGTLTIDWGDGSAPSTVSIGCGSSTTLCPTPSAQPLSCPSSLVPGLACGWFNVPHVYLGGGTFTVQLTADDGDGGSDTAEATATITGAAIDTAPTVTSVNQATFSVGSAGSFTVTTTGYPTAALSEIGSLPSGVTFTDNGNGTATLSGTPGAVTAGDYGLTISAENGILPNASQAFTLHVHSAPAITSASSTTFAVGSAGSFTVTASGVPVAALDEVGALPAGVTFVDNGDGSATIAGTPAPGTSGTWVVVLSAANGVAPDASQTFTLDVSQRTQAITFGALAARTYGVAPFGVSASATSGLDVTFTASPSTVCAAGGTNGATITVVAVGTGTCSVTAHQAGDGTWLAASDVTRTFSVAQKPIAVPVTPATVQYSDPLPSLNVMGTVSGLVGSDALSGSLSGCTASGLSTSGGMVTSPAGSYPLSGCTGLSNANYSISYSGSLTVAKEAVTAEYGGPNYASTGSASATKATVTLTGQLTQEADGHLGDATKATAQFLLFNSANLTLATPDITVNATVNALGVATGTASNLAIDTYTVILRVMPSNTWFGGPEADADLLTVFQPATGTWVSGGGWVIDPSTGNLPVAVSASGPKGHFGFDVSYGTKKSSTPKGHASYSFRGADGYVYVIKSTSWQGGALMISGDHGAWFAGKANVTAIDPTTGLAVPGIGGGNFAFRVDVYDGSATGTGDTYALSVYTPSGALYHRVGTAASQVPVKGGNLTVHAK